MVGPATSGLQGSPVLARRILGQFMRSWYLSHMRSHFYMYTCVLSCLVGQEALVFSTPPNVVCLFVINVLPTTKVIRGR